MIGPVVVIDAYAGDVRMQAVTIANIAIEFAGEIRPLSPFALSDMGRCWT